MASIKDIAKEAGVAPSTVSLVLNKKGYVSEETRRKVESVIEKLHYIPSEVARNLSLQRTKTIGVIVPSISHQFFSEVVETLETELYKLDYKMMLCCTKYKENSERTFIDMLKRKTMDGVIMGAHSLDVSIYDNLECPIIAFDRYLNKNIPIVHSDHKLGGELAANVFLRHDCQHIVEIAGYQGVDSPANEYHSTFHKIMKSNGVKTDMLEMPWNAFDYRDYLQAAEELFKKFPDVDGIFGSDMAIASCMNVAATQGRKIPQDLKLVAYDGTSLIHMGIYSITAVRQQIEKLSEIAAKKIINRINGIEDDLSWIVEPYLIEGETC